MTEPVLAGSAQTRQASRSQVPGPDVFFVGAPKSGTTALAHYLSSHPELFVAAKELLYFGSDLDIRTRRGLPWRITWPDYLAWFADADRAKHRIDRSVFYLYSTQAASEIHAYRPDSRILIMLRNPVDQMHSQHAEMVFQGEEDIEDFEVALYAEEERVQGRRIPPACQKAFGLYYRRLARYSKQVERYLTQFGREQVLVLLYEDLASDPSSVYRQALGFLGLSDAHQPAFAVVNSNKVVWSPTVRSVLRSTSPRLRRAGRMVVPHPRARAALRRRLQSLNTRHAPRRRLDETPRRQLLTEFAEDIHALEDLLHRDLSRWFSGTRPGS